MTLKQEVSMLVEQTVGSLASVEETLRFVDSINSEDQLQFLKFVLECAQDQMNDLKNEYN